MTDSTQRLMAECKACLQLAIPLSGALLAQSATGFIDTLMMGWLGSITLASGGLGASIFQAFLLISTGVLSAVSPAIAIAYGEGQTTAIGKIVRQGLWLAIGLTIPISGLLWNAQAWLPRLGQSVETVNLALPYLRSIAWGIAPALGFAVLRNFVSALSDPRPVIVIVLGGTGINILFNYALMFGKWGLPALGLAGIGWASALSLWTMLTALVLYIIRQPRYRAYQVFKGLNQLEVRIFRDLLHIGIPVGILSLVETGMFTVTTLLMGTLGTVTLAAHQIALQTAAMTFMVPMGIALATTVRVGQMLGQQDRAGAELAGKVGISVAAGFMSLMGLLIWLFPERIVSLYLDVNQPENAAVLSLAQQLLCVAAIFQLFDGLQVSAAGALRGLKDTRIPMLIGLVAYWGIGLTSGYVLGILAGLGGTGLWCGLAMGLAAAAVVLIWRFNALLNQEGILESRK